MKCRPFSQYLTFNRNLPCVVGACVGVGPKKRKCTKIQSVSLTFYLPLLNSQDNREMNKYTLLTYRALFFFSASVSQSRVGFDWLPFTP